MSLVDVAAMTGHVSVTQLNRYTHSDPKKKRLDFLEG
jgi:hypothetical protein